MPKTRFVLGLIVVLGFGLCVHPWAANRDVPFQPKNKLMEKSLLREKETKKFHIPSPWSSKRTQKVAKRATDTGAISGRITQAQGGAGIENVSISAYQLECPFDLFQVYSGSDGYYILDGLPSGHYFVSTYNESGFVDVYYDDKPSWGTADTVGVSANDTATGIDFSLRVGGKITGTLTLPGYSYVAAWISATDTTSRDLYSVYVWNAGGESATYVIRGLPTGIYKLKTENYFGYVDVYYNDKSGWATADPVPVTEGDTTSGIDFTLSIGGTIEGNVSTSAKDSLGGIPVWAYYASNPEWVQYTVSDMDGNYTLNGLRSGYWKILAYGDTTYAFEWYSNKDTWEQADSVQVTTAKSKIGIDFALEFGGAIMGIVYVFGNLVPGLDVIAYQGNPYGKFPGRRQSEVSSFQPVIMKWDTTKADGTYRISGLRTGDYVVTAYTECDQLFYNNQTSWEDADLVHVIMPNETSGIDFNFTTAVESEDEIAQPPTDFELYQNYPNPFNPETKIEYTLRKGGPVTLCIYNLLGEKVRTLLDQDQPAGFYQINWDGKNDKGKSVSSGLYLYELKVNGFSQAKRMLLLK